MDRHACRSQNSCRRNLHRGRLQRRQSFRRRFHQLCHRREGRRASHLDETRDEHGGEIGSLRADQIVSASTSLNSKKEPIKMRLLIKTSNWRMFIASMLVIGSCFFLSETFAKSNRTRSTNKASSTTASSTTITFGPRNAPTAAGPKAPNAPSPAASGT